MGAWRAILMSIVVASIGGCSLLVSTDGLVGSPGPSPDGGPAGADASDASSGGPDASAPDAPDSATLLPFCASQSPKPRFCADFDTGALADFKTITGTLSFESAVASSPPRSLLGVVETDATTRAAYLSQDFPGLPSSFDLAFDVYVSEYDVTHDVELMTVALDGTTAGNCSPDIAIRNGLWTFDEYCVKNGTPTVEVSHATNVTAARERWVHLALAVSFSPARTYSLSIDGQKVFDALPLDGILPGAISFHAGIVYLQRGATRARVYFDNARFDFR